MNGVPFEKQNVMFTFVEEHPSLWNPADPQKKNKQVNDRLWAELAKKLELEVSVVKASWTQFRQKFTTESSQMKAELMKSGSKGRPRRPWSYLQVLAFLKVAITHRPTQSNMPGDLTIPLDLTPQHNETVVDQRTSTAGNSSNETLESVCPYCGEVELCQCDYDARSLAVQYSGPVGGEKSFADGPISSADGAISFADGAISSADGAISSADGAISSADEDGYVSSDATSLNKRPASVPNLTALSKKKSADLSGKGRSDRKRKMNLTGEEVLSQMTKLETMNEAMTTVLNQPVPTPDKFESLANFFYLPQILFGNVFTLAVFECMMAPATVSYNEHRLRRKKLILLHMKMINNMAIDLARHYFESTNVRPRAYAVRPVHRNRDRDGAYALYLNSVRQNDPQLHLNFVRMSKERFDHLLSLIESKLARGYTTNRPVTPGMQLAATLRFLTSTCSMGDIKIEFYLGRSTVSGAIYRTCAAIWDVLAPIYLKFPSTAQEWKAISDDFYEMWNFPLCVGALDGKHVRIQAPPLSGSQFFNHKGFHSIVLMACCDAKYRFTYVDIGGFGRSSDAGLFNRSEFGRKLNENDLSLPAPSYLPNSEIEANYTFIGDEGFPLKPNLMRPFSGRRKDGLDHRTRIFNYRLSRARRVIENCFGIMSARFRTFRTEMTCTPDNAELLTKAAVCLHNYLMFEDGATYSPPGFADYTDGNGVLQEGQWRQLLQNGQGLGNAMTAGRAHTLTATEMRDKLADYFLSDAGKLDYQDQMI